MYELAHMYGQEYVLTKNLNSRKGLEQEGITIKAEKK